MRASNRFDRVCRRLEEIRRASLTPAVKREAYRRFLETGELPDDPTLKDLVEHLRDAETELEILHRLAPVGQE